MKKNRCGLAMLIALMLLLGTTAYAEISEDLYESGEYIEDDYVSGEYFEDDSNYAENIETEYTPEMRSYFPDVSPDAEYAEAVNALAEMGLFTGDNEGNFNPNSTITRSEFATIMCRFLGEEEAAKAIKASSFNDVPSSHWACGYVTKAVELGLVGGYGDGNFGPEDTLTYEQAVKVLVCAIGLEDDAVQAGGYPSGYMTVANDLDLLRGTAKIESAPAVRFTIAQLIYNIFDNGIF